MFVYIEKNPDGSHAFQYGGIIQDGWAYWDTNKVEIPSSFPYVDIETEEVIHPAVTGTQRVTTEDNEVVEETIELMPAYTQIEVVSATERDVPEEEENNEPTQLDIIEAQVAYTAMMTDTLLEV